MGIDNTEAAIEQARASYHERTRFLVSDLLSLDVGTFDIVVCNELLYFVPNYGALLDHLREVLRFELVDRVWARNERNRIGWRGWGVAMLVRRATVLGK